MRLNLRGRYHGGGMTITARHWWSISDRESARVAAAILEDKADELRERTVAASRDLLVYGYPRDGGWVVSDAEWLADVRRAVTGTPNRKRNR